MSTVLAVIALGAALACPAHLLWRTRRGQGGGCMPSRQPIEELSERQTRLADDLVRVTASRS